METVNDNSVVVPFGNMDESSVDDVVKFGSGVTVEVPFSVNDDVTSVSRVSGELPFGIVLVSCSSVVVGDSDEGSLEGDGLVMVSSVIPSVEFDQVEGGSEEDEEVESGLVSGGVTVSGLTDASVVNLLDDPSSGVVIELSKSSELVVISVSTVVSEIFDSVLIFVGSV